MSRLPHAIPSEQWTSECAIRYEALRNQAIERHAPVARHGLAVLLRHGMAAWMDAWSKVPAPPPRSAKDDSLRPCPVPDGSSAEVIRVLVAMAMGHIQEVLA